MCVYLRHTHFSVPHLVSVTKVTRFRNRVLLDEHLVDTANWT